MSFRDAFEEPTGGGGAHGPSHVSTGSDPVPDTVAGGASGLLSGTRATKLDGIETGALKRPETNYAAPQWANYNLAIVASTWTRLNNGTINAPQISVPILGEPPAGTAWQVEVSGYLRFNSPGATNTFIGFQFNNGTMGAVHGGGQVPQSGGELKLLAGRLAPPSTTQAFTIDFAFFSTVAGTFTFIWNPFPMARVYLVPA